MIGHDEKSIWPIIRIFQLSQLSLEPDVIQNCLKVWNWKLSKIFESCLTLYKHTNKYCKKLFKVHHVSEYVISGCILSGFSINRVQILIKPVKSSENHYWSVLWRLLTFTSIIPTAGSSGGWPGSGPYQTSDWKTGPWPGRPGPDLGRTEFL